MIAAPGSRLRTVRRLLPSVVLAILLAVGGLALVRQLVPFEVLKDTNDEVGNYLQTVGTVYAVLLAFVVFVVWNQFNETRLLVEAEANEVLDLFRTARGFGPAVRRPIQHELRAYAEQVLRHEWAVMARSDELPDVATEQLDRLWDQLLRFEPASECHRALYDQMLDRFNDLSDLRARRLLASRTRIPLALKILVYSGAVTTVASCYLFAIERFSIHAIVTGALAGAIAHIIYVVADLDRCFSGDWQVPRVAFERVQRVMERSDEPAAAA